MGLTEQSKGLLSQTGLFTLNYPDLQTLARCSNCMNDARIC